jgi:ABC-type amino acid transport substrate-binding protein
LLVAALLAISAGTLLIPGTLQRLIPVRQDALDDVTYLGRIRIAIRSDHPQFSVGGLNGVGFDDDVASELAKRIGVRAEVSIVDVAAMLAVSPTLATDIALPSVPSWSIDRSRFNITSPYYYWPHRLVVSDSSSATGLSDVSAGPICAVSGDAGEAWLRGNYGGVVGTPVTPSIVTAATDDDCLLLVSSGGAVAAVTAHLSDADLQVRAGIRVIGGPGAEPRAVIAMAETPTGRTTTGLIAAVNGALSAMRADGTLTRLSENRFGGADLTHQ